MISTKRFFSIKRQRGDFLVEAVIGLILVSIIRQGMLLIASRTAKAQTNLSLQEIAVNQMRAALMQNRSGSIDICGSAPVISLPNAVSITAEVQGCGTYATVEINGTSVSDVPNPIRLSVTHALLGGQVVVGGTWDTSS